jgi:dihydropteroate synthase
MGSSPDQTQPTPGLPGSCCDRWTLRDRTLAVGRLPLLMGIVNVTPDSFSDGGQFFDASAAVEHGLRLAREGADLVDVGGESTRPGASGIDADEEIRRVIAVVAALCEQSPVPISIDTSKAVVAREAVAAGVQVINDVTGLAGDPEMIDAAVELAVGVCVMHMQGKPRTMQENPTYRDVVEDVLAYLRHRRDALVSAGIDQARIAIDPGIGFGKTRDHNLALLSNAWRFHELGCPMLVGHSRKRFIGDVLGDREADRTPGTIGVALSLARQGVQVLRVHDVAAVRQALLLCEATGGLVPDRDGG